MRHEPVSVAMSAQAGRAEERTFYTANTVHSDALKLTASDPKNLSEQSWRFPKLRYTKPLWDQGGGSLDDRSDEWLIVAGNSKQQQQAI
ncbi:hypothetical protein [Glaciimonas immobilis]|uniref:Uncharacterized protein n=1 Tax=Glaciimonas immobilis TaxID=728004 RepID=A0A840RY99_9BURK|nr:hypothetical protein [Glaciimonas immobilis]KAF3996361.1 hypothetical protein HAV38_19310 [Glaciimonas immobilis]MBB5202202.1 hypothetical protein [Glaciimonas immobilis]